MEISLFKLIKSQEEIKTLVQLASFCFDLCCPNHQGINGRSSDR